MNISTTTTQCVDGYLHNNTMCWWISPQQQQHNVLMNISTTTTQCVDGYLHNNNNTMCYGYLHNNVSLTNEPFNSPWIAVNTHSLCIQMVSMTTPFQNNSCSQVHPRIPNYLLILTHHTDTHIHTHKHTYTNKHTYKPVCRQDIIITHSKTSPPYNGMQWSVSLTSRNLFVCLFVCLCPQLLYWLCD